jgi:AAA domain
MERVMKPITQDELDELLGTDPLTLASRRPFQNWTDDDIDALPDLQWLVGDEDHPVLLEGSLWQTIGLLKSAKTFYCLEIAFCVAFGLKFHGLDVKQGKVVYILAEGGIKRNYKRVRALYQKYRDQMQAKGYDSLKACPRVGQPDHDRPDHIARR